MTPVPCNGNTFGIDLDDLMMKLGDAPGRKTVLYPATLWHLRMDRHRGWCDASSSSASTGLLAKAVLDSFWKKRVLENPEPAPAR